MDPISCEKYATTQQLSDSETIKQAIWINQGNKLSLSRIKTPEISRKWHDGSRWMNALVGTMGI